MGVSDLTTPNGCGHCRVSEGEHYSRWDQSVGWHPWIAPTDEQRLARMRARREERKGRVPNPRAALDALEARLANADDRELQEFRDRHPERLLAIDACRAVADLHSRDTDGTCRVCIGTYEDPIPWPCPTVRVINDALKETS